ncbi:hypothetical protein PpBr36_07473 [Pyricularia pennisetigena]|uniref:hypothetical protein n=1 Tax=Pyricularia pennisetigena TaxID=1578925 RepID=UPI0011543B1A|nr:hypothetical protein PpBr36_07473 [Pyricularia pennisetigena]TLS25024.1 hypothetical protein PpBr36_07473 [Pyricularia pennisetigena]
MAGYNGRRAPNVAQYLRELNTIQPATPAASADSFGGSLDEDLMMFTNTQFFDFETGENTDYQSQPHKDTPPSTVSPSETQQPMSAAASTTTMDDFSSMDFMSGDLNFSDFGGPYASSTMHSYPEPLSSLQSIQQNPQQTYAMAPPAQRPLPPQPNAYAAQQQQPRLAASSTKARPPTEQTRPTSQDEASRLAAEEDKRRRNTAASARFRVKKKQREQALEKSAKEMNDKVNALEGRINQLETENKWLKNLIMEKNDGNEDIAKLWKEFSAKQQAGDGDKSPKAEKKKLVASPEEHEADDFTG